MTWWQIALLAYGILALIEYLFLGYLWISFTRKEKQIRNKKIGIIK